MPASLFAGGGGGGGAAAFFSATGGLVAAGAGLAEVGVAELLDPSRPLNKAAAILCFSDITPDSCLAGAPPKEGFEG